MRFIATLICFLLASIFSVPAFAAVSNANILSINSATTNIPTASYVQLAASSPVASRRILAVNTTTSIIIIGIGSAGNEMGLYVVGPSSTLLIDLATTLPAGTRIALEALNTAASTGYVAVSLHQ